MLLIYDHIILDSWLLIKLDPYERHYRLDGGLDFLHKLQQSVEDFQTSQLLFWLPYIQRENSSLEQQKSALLPFPKFLEREPGKEELYPREQAKTLFWLTYIDSQMRVY